MSSKLPNLGKLAGRTVFITGASRGIGKAIAEKCARDGANIVIAAKTVTPHPKLPGTIYTSAKELEDLGAKCLPCEVDIRDEQQLGQAIDEAVNKFGGIDILVNNAGAISLTNTDITSSKKFDLMMSVNLRGPYLCSKLCLPHLKKGTNPHILNLSPPINLNKRWFKDHAAYTISKYGMSMCVLGMAEEFRESGIAVNALWPKMAVYTAAMEMLGGGSEVKNQCRKPDIMADAAYAIFTKDSRSFTGNFVIDEDLLRREGITDFSSYNYVENPSLLPDFFLDDVAEDFAALKKQVASKGAVPSPSTSAASTASIADPELSKSFELIKSFINEDIVRSVGGVFLFNLKDNGFLHLDLKNSPGAAGVGELPASLKADATMTLSKEDFVKMFAGQLNPTAAFMAGKLKIKGDLGAAMKLEKLMKSTKSKL